ncbi:GNAT family N-acetyltransferase [Hoeflea ulvae]|uniref:GNAT family N-acetyltransferase n=1 Tax=Hoeflea ulvae TaxID=2983764 RepID=A0ABT3YAB3_9HYPH|nr:GNAT family N-acetyltransferase [Hoeflea ulvae]MCY0092830.1 GNAT family N-acetyltransferase [Hoeflea ulvae]
MSLIDAGRIGFRPVSADDYPLLERWLNTPHWQEWWGEPATELGYIRDMVVGRDTTRPFVFTLDGLPAGYIQVWFIADHLVEPWLSEAPWMSEVPADSVGVDISIGATTQLSRGLGSTVVRLFAERLRAEGHQTILIDPALTNHRAIRAYEKAGFERLLVSRESPDDESPATLIMKLASPGARTDRETT